MKENEGERDGEKEKNEMTRMANKLRDKLSGEGKILRKTAGGKNVSVVNGKEN